MVSARVLIEFLIDKQSGNIKSEGDGPILFVGPLTLLVGTQSGSGYGDKPRFPPGLMPSIKLLDPDLGPDLNRWIRQLQQILEGEPEEATILC